MSEKHKDTVLQTIDELKEINKEIKAHLRKGIARLRLALLNVQGMSDDGVSYIDISLYIEEVLDAED